MREVDMRWVLLLIAVIGTNAMAGEFVMGIKPDSLDPAKAKAVIEEIWQQAQVYYQDRGHWPEAVERLIETNYISIDSATRAQWKFDISYHQYPSFIKAEPNVRREGDPAAMTQVNFDYFDVNTLTYEVSSGHWQGPGVPDFSKTPPTPEQQFELTKEVRGALEHIASSLQLYYQERGHYPKELEQTRYVEFTPGVYVQWEFNLIGDPPTAIEAISSHVMPGGKGQILRYDLQQKKFSGYGVEE
jgi:hypothetical protein